jgi:hypothetical protein
MNDNRRIPGVSDIPDHIDFHWRLSLLTTEQPINAQMEGEWRISGSSFALKKDQATCSLHRLLYSHTFY